MYNRDYIIYHIIKLYNVYNFTVRFTVKIFTSGKVFNLFWKLFLSSIQFWLTFFPFNTLEIPLFYFLSCPVLTWNVWLFIPCKWCIFFPLRLLFSDFFLCLFKSNLILICLGIVFYSILNICVWDLFGFFGSVDYDFI